MKIHHPTITVHQMDTSSSTQMLYLEADGSLVAKYHKLNLYAGEKTYFNSGGVLPNTPASHLRHHLVLLLGHLRHAMTCYSLNRRTVFLTGALKISSCPLHGVVPFHFICQQLSSRRFYILGSLWVGQRSGLMKSSMRSTKLLGLRKFLKIFTRSV